MDFEIPKQFELFGLTFDVIIEDKRNDDKSSYGFAEFSSQKIYIASQHGLIKLSSDKMKKVFCHELVHIILDSMGKNELSNDEDFVHIFGNLLFQFVKTAR